MGMLSLIKILPKKSHMVVKKEPSLENIADSILRKRGNQIRSGLKNQRASTGRPMSKIYGGAKKMAQLANIGGGSKAICGGGVDEGLKAMIDYVQADTVKKLQPKKTKKSLFGKR